MKRARSIIDLPFLVAALACLPLPARGEDSKPERSLASQVGRSAHKVENGIHKGSMVLGVARNDPLGLIGAFQLDYALWTLLDEPVEDYLFRWELKPELMLRREDLMTGWEKPTLERLRREDPDLYKRLEALTPVNVTLRARVRFYAPGTQMFGLPFAEADLDITPDLTAPSGKPQPFSVPGSPEWGAWMKNVDRGKNIVVVEGKMQGICAGSDFFDNARCLKAIWKVAKRVELASVGVIGVEWPEVEARMLFAEIADRHRRAEQRTSDRAASDEDFWSKPAPPAPPPAAQRSDLQTKTVAETNRPLDKRARQARQKRYDEQNQKGFSLWTSTDDASCSRGEIIIYIDKSLGEAAPAVAWDGSRLKDDASDAGDRNRHEFSFPVSLGEHALDITFAGTRRIERHDRLRCYTEEKTRSCQQLTCPRFTACECERLK